MCVGDRRTATDRTLPGIGSDWGSGGSEVQYGACGPAHDRSSRIRSAASPAGNTADLMIDAVNNRVVALENVSSLPTWLSDDLAALATGGRAEQARPLHRFGGMCPRRAAANPA